MTPGATRKLGIYFVILGFTLLYLAFVIWPPDYQSLPASGTREEDKGKNPISPIVFFDNAPCPQKTASTPDKLLGKVTTPVPNGKPASAPSIPAPDGASPGGTGATSAAPVATPTPAGGNPTPPAQGGTEGSPGANPHTPHSSGDAARSCRWRIFVTYDQRLFLLVLILGALGSYIHAVMSFADFAGNRRLVQSWLWWYLLRPFAGAPIALVLYFAVRAGFMTPTATGGDVSRFGIAALAMLAGMFSMKAADKLEEVFDVLFKTQEKRKDSLENLPPVLNSITPAKVKVGSGAQKIVLEGSNFSAKAVVLVDGAERVPVEVTAIKVTIVLSADEVNTSRAIKLAVKNPPPGGGSSAALSLTVEA